LADERVVKPSFGQHSITNRTGRHEEVYVSTNKQVGDAEHIKTFANQDTAKTWFEENDPEGVAFEYEVIGPEIKMAPARGRAPRPSKVFTFLTAR
jgi:hypothetical protein